MTFPKEQIWNLYRKLRIGFEEIRKYAFAYINTVRQGLQGIFSDIGQSDIRKQGNYLIRLKNFNCTGTYSVLLFQHNCKKYLTSNLTKSSRSPAGVAKSNSSGWGPFTNCFPVR